MLGSEGEVAQVSLGSSCFFLTVSVVPGCQGMFNDDSGWSWSSMLVCFQFGRQVASSQCRSKRDKCEGGPVTRRL